MMEMVCVFWIFLAIITPTIDNVRSTRLMFLELMFPEKDDDIPIEAVSIMQETIDKFLTHLEQVYSDSFLKFSFADPKNPCIIMLSWLNGTSQNVTSLDLDVKLFTHINYFELYTQYYLFNVAEDSYTGCTMYTCKLRFVIASGSYLFHLVPDFSRDECPESLFRIDKNTYQDTLKQSDEDVMSDEELFNQVLKLIKAGTLEANAPQPQVLHYSPKKGRMNSQKLKSYSSVLPTFKRESLTLYHTMERLGLFLLECTLIEMVSLTIQLTRQFLWHKHLMSTNPQYEDLPTYDQFHGTIGFWLPLNLITAVLSFSTSVCLLYDARHFSQYPSPRTCHMFGLSSLFSIIIMLKWLQPIPKIYSVALVIRAAFLRLAYVSISIAPVVIGLMLIGIFLFGFVSKTSESMLVFFQTTLAVTFGDMIFTFYEEFTDNSKTYNLIGFIYCTVFCAFAMWIIFTSFTATMTDVYKDKVHKHMS